MSTSLEPGFLVVLADTGYRNARNPRYVGVDRLPPYSPMPYGTHLPEETEPLEAYVFGDYKSPDSSLITDYLKALELWGQFAVSRRRFEILFCGVGPDDPKLCKTQSLTKAIDALGYDVAGMRGDCWSIVEDIPASEWAAPFAQALNENGLLSLRVEAQRYLDGYREHKEPDCDIPFDVVFVARVIPAVVK